MKKRLQVVLAHAGIAARRKAAEIIAAGRVSVNGVRVTEKGAHCDPERDRIEVDGTRVYAEQKKYFVLNKPRGFLTTVTDDRGRKTVLDLMPRNTVRVYPVGRLDQDTEGVLILTNDGDLAHRLAHPRYQIDKEYRVELTGLLDEAGRRELERGGIDIDGKKTSPCTIRISPNGTNSMIAEVVLHEGRKRQIRKMFESKGCRVRRLIRTVYAGITCDGLLPGYSRSLRKKEITALLQIVQQTHGR